MPSGETRLFGLTKADFLEAGFPLEKWNEMVEKEKAGEKRKEEERAAAMEARKKRREAGPNPEEDKKKALKKLYFERMQDKQDEIGAIGQMLIVGINRKGGKGGDDDSEDDDDESQDEEDEPKVPYTQEELDTLRFILVTQRRADLLDEMREVVLEDQAHDMIVMLNTRFSYHILDLIDEYASLRIKDPKLKFDRLLAFTYTIYDQDTWVFDHEEPERIVAGVNKLGKAWKKLLSMSNAELGIDGEYTRPGTIALCQKLWKKVKDEDVEDYNGKGPAKWKLG
mmetsp:Transcript_38927/g.90770  ORF Transcript_38927/g.90770 Transcript_38927/m.90770 type:complete len:282 (-) Transcript_38927:333-1178(-)